MRQQGNEGKKILMAFTQAARKNSACMKQEEGQASSCLIKGRPLHRQDLMAENAPADGASCLVFYPGLVWFLLSIKLLFKRKGQTSILKPSKATSMPCLPIKAASSSWPEFLWLMWESIILSGFKRSRILSTPSWSLCPRPGPG